MNYCYLPEELFQLTLSRRLPNRFTNKHTKEMKLIINTLLRKPPPLWLLQRFCVALCIIDTLGFLILSLNVPLPFCYQAVYRLPLQSMYAFLDPNSKILTFFLPHPHFLFLRSCQVLKLAFPDFFVTLSPSFCPSINTFINEMLKTPNGTLVSLVTTTTTTTTITTATMPTCYLHYSKPTLEIQVLP